MTPRNRANPSEDLEKPQRSERVDTDIVLALRSSIEWHEQQGRPHSAGVDRDALAEIESLRALVKALEEYINTRMGKPAMATHGVKMLAIIRKSLPEPPNKNLAAWQAASELHRLDRDLPEQESAPPGKEKE